MEESVKRASKDLRVNWALEFWPKRIISIVSPSRSGSTVFKYALELHPEICSLAGEEEPYYKLARNGYPWHKSDEFHDLKSPALGYMRCLIANELHNYQTTHNRQVLQRCKVEEPPFVKPVTCYRTSTLLLKTPQNCYRRGVLEQIYPQARVDYVRITRDSRAVVNGLIDGWLSGDFTARKTPEGWWCFDMPPNWSWENSLLDTCINQESQASRYLDQDYSDALRVSFEAFLEDWQATCLQVWASLGLAPYTPSESELPALMTTKDPTIRRWKACRPWLREVVKS